MSGLFLGSLLLLAQASSASAQADPHGIMISQRGFDKTAKVGEYRMGGWIWSKQPKALQEVTFKLTILGDGKEVLETRMVKVHEFVNRTYAMQGSLLPFSLGTFGANVSVDQAMVPKIRGYWIDVESFKKDDSAPTAANPYPLFAAVMAQSVDETIKMLDANPSFLAFSDPQTGANLMHLAATRSDARLLDYLYAKNVKLESTGWYGLFPIHSAASANQTHTLKWLATHAQSLESSDNVRARPIHWACINRSHDSLRTLIELGADIEAPSSDGTRPMHLAARDGDAETVRILFKAKAKLESSTDEGLHPLHLAVGKDNEATTRQLIELGADVNATESKQPWVPLHTAAKKGSLKCIEILLAHGANPKIKTINSNTPAMLARKYGFPIVAERLEEAERQAGG